MGGNEIDNLFRSKAEVAKRGRVGFIVAVCVAILSAICGVVAYGVVKSRSAVAEQVPPAAVETRAPTPAQIAQPETPTPIATEFAQLETPAPISTESAQPETPAPMSTESVQPETPAPVVESRSPARFYAHELKMVWLGGSEPEEDVQVEILLGDTVTKTLIVSADSGWTAHWEDRYPSEELTLAGSLPQGSDVSYALNGNSFVLTARLGQVVNVESEGKYLPKTGLCWTAVVLLSLLACSCFVSYFWIKKNQA